MSGLSLKCTREASAYGASGSIKRGVKSLSELARNACLKYVTGIIDVGDYPFEVMAAILRKVDSPEQLHLIETNSPQIIGEDKELWVRLIKRDIPNWESKLHQYEHSETWYEVYRHLKDESLADIDKGATALKAALSRNQAEKEQNLSKVLSRREAPREAPSYAARAIHNVRTGNARMGGRPPTRPQLSIVQKLRKKPAGATVNRTTMYGSPKIPSIRNQIQAAPKGFVRDLKLDAQKKATTFSSSSSEFKAASAAESVYQSSPPELSLQEREKRLLALQIAPSGSMPGRSDSLQPSSQKTTPPSIPAPKVLKRKPEVSIFATSKRPKMTK